MCKFNRKDSTVNEQVEITHYMATHLVEGKITNQNVDVKVFKGAQPPMEKMPKQNMLIIKQT